MTNNLSDKVPEAGLSETRIEQIKQTLEHLHDPGFLQSHPLAGEFAPGGALPDRMAGKQLRRKLVEAIEALNPGEGIGLQVPAARPYHVLHLHYLEGMTLQQTALELGISERQIYRDLRHGLESIAAFFQPAPPTVRSEPPARSAFDDEVQRLKTAPRLIDLSVLLKQALQAVQRLADVQKVALQCAIPETPALIIADQAFAQQLLTQLLSRVIQQAQARPLSVTLRGEADQADQSQYEIVLHCRARAANADAERILNRPLSRQLLAGLGWELAEIRNSADSDTLSLTVTIRISAHWPTLLVIDDNEGLVALLERYLSGGACRVIGAVNGQIGLRLAQEARPDVIVLDVMMPEIDGWAVLQRLRSNPLTQAIPVIIFSVYHDPELAFSLGADRCLAKPCSQEDFLRTLCDLAIL